MCYPPVVEPDDISEANSQKYFAIGVVEDKENIEIFPTTNTANEDFEVRAETEYGGKITNLIYTEVVYFVKLHLYWLEKIMDFTGPSQKNNVSRAFVIKQKALNFRYFIPKVPCFLKVLIDRK